MIFITELAVLDRGVTRRLCLLFLYLLKGYNQGRLQGLQKNNLED